MRGRTFPWSRPTTGTRPSANTLARLGVFAILICLLAAAFNFGSAAKSAAVKQAAAAATTAPRAEAAGINHVKEVAAPSVLSSVTLPLAPAPVLQAPSAPSIETYNCATQAAQEVFNLNDHVCARATGVPPAVFSEFQWRVSWVDPGGLIEQRDFAEVDTTTAYDYQLPPDDISNRGLEDAIVVANRGTWRVNLTRASGAIYATASFTVRGNTPVSDIYVQKFLSGANGFVNSGSPVKFIVVVANAGPNSAANVLLADSAPAGSSLASFSQVAGPQCLPADTPNCTVSSLDSGGRAEFEAVYIAGGTPGTVQTSATVSTDTAELATDNNTASAQFEVSSGGGGTTCALVCPNDMVVAANAFEGTTHGANVVFGNAEHFGSCGTITANPISGSFFPVGTSNVSISSSEGGGSCSFSVTVTEDPPPDVTCPAPVSATAESGCSTEISAEALGTATSTGGTAPVTIEAVRSDSKPLSDPYPVGTTTITYTATDSLGRIDSCTQAVTVAPGNDTENPTITAPDDITLSTGTSGGACGLVVGEAQLGTAEAADDGCTVAVTRTGVPAGNFFPVGQTTVTWVATDAAGKTATDTQVVTVTEDTPPSIQAPPDAAYTCVENVPAANPSQANGGDPNQPGGGPVSDNCGVPVVGVTESRSGAGSASSPLIITRTFTATDASGNTASSVQTITVIDSTPPSIALVGPASVTHECHTPFTDQGVTTSDNCDAAVTVTTSGGFNPDAPGNYTITYTATDGVGNTATVTRAVTVVDTIAPVITLNGASVVTHECHTPYTDAGATATDSCDTDVPVNVGGSVNADAVGTYVLTYTASDDTGNAATAVTRTVNVVDTTPPVITTNGSTPSLWPANHKYVSFQVTSFVTGATDSCDTPLGVSSVKIEKVTSDETENGNGDGNTTQDILIGADCKSFQVRAERQGNGDGRVYTVTFMVTDASGNVGRATAKIVVQHNPGESPVDSGAHYTVNGTCP
jgi:uncharacterized repeat protein (TIGR01451 family)